MGLTPSCFDRPKLYSSPALLLRKSDRLLASGSARRLHGGTSRTGRRRHRTRGRGAERPRHAPLPNARRRTERRGAAWQRGAAGRCGGGVRDARPLAAPHRGTLVTGPGSGGDGLRRRPRGCDGSGAVCSARRDRKLHGRWRLRWRAERRGGRGDRPRRGRKLHGRWRLRWRSERRRWRCRPGAAGAPKRRGAERPRHVPLPKTVDRCTGRRTERRRAAWQRGAAGRRGGSVRDARPLGGSLVRCSAAVIPASPGGTLKQRARWRPWHAKRVA